MKFQLDLDLSWGGQQEGGGAVCCLDFCFFLIGQTYKSACGDAHVSNTSLFWGAMFIFRGFRTSAM